MVLINLHRNLHEKSSFLSEIMFIRINPYLCHLLTRYQSTIFPNHKSCVRKKGVPESAGCFSLLAGQRPVKTAFSPPPSRHASPFIWSWRKSARHKTDRPSSAALPSDDAGTAIDDHVLTGDITRSVGRKIEDRRFNIFSNSLSSSTIKIL